MYNKQVFSNSDPLKFWKQSVQQEYPNYAFYNHTINGNLEISSGYSEKKLITETIITDGNISIQKKPFARPTIIWANHIITLDNGTCITIDISKATFMVNIIKRQKETQYDIHVEENDQELLTKILTFLQEQQGQTLDTNSITFVSPSILILQSIVKGRKKATRININTKDAREKYLEKRKRKTYVKREK